MENSRMWIGTLLLTSMWWMRIVGDEQDPVEQEGDVDAVDIMVLLLTEGLPDDTEKEVWCCVDVSNGA
jgi:hypothetical protein